jgi:hypothetical protein
MMSPMKGDSMRGGSAHLASSAPDAQPDRIVLRGSKAVLTATALVILVLRPAAGAQMCVGDCSSDSEVTVGELITFSRSM